MQLYTENKLKQKVISAFSVRCQSCGNNKGFCMYNSVVGLKLHKEITIV